MTTFMLPLFGSLRRRLKEDVQLVHGVPGQDEVGRVARLERASLHGKETPPAPIHRHHRDGAFLLKRADGGPDQMVRDLALQVEERAPGEALLQLLPAV